MLPEPPPVCQSEAATRDQLDAVQQAAEAVLHEAEVDWGRKQVSVPWKAFFALADTLHVRPGLRRADDEPRPGPLGTNCGG